MYLYAQFDFAESQIVNRNDVYILPEVIEGSGCFSAMCTTQYYTAWYHGKQCMVKRTHSKDDKYCQKYF